MQWALVNLDNIIVNLIVYDGVSPYVPDLDLRLLQVDADKIVGDSV